MLVAKPESVFIKSLYDQYCNRGGLSKKQLEGLYAKALKIDSIPPGKLATLEAIIKKKPTRYKSEAPAQVAALQKNETVGQTIDAILSKYPMHKRLLFLQSKYKNNDPISAAEISEIEKFKLLLLKG
jgi:predicted ribonuclease toxin of YeeF-YezG toxin-antitoxin module